MRSYSHLSEDESDQIGVLRAAGRSMGAIARALGRAKATISRELQRNALPSGGYSPLHAAGAYQLRRRREAILPHTFPSGANSREAEYHERPG
jgi:IS30 family transposase